MICSGGMSSPSCFAPHFSRASSMISVPETLCEYTPDVLNVHLYFRLRLVGDFALLIPARLLGAAFLLGASFLLLGAYPVLI